MESGGRQKAGFIPYFITPKGIHMLFCLSSDSAYGGNKFMIGKGCVDAGETLEQAALREASEELGLKASNLKKETIQIGYNQGAPLTVYIGEVINPEDFDKPGFEVSETKWFAPAEFYRIGRFSQREIVRQCEQKINASN